MSNVDAVTAFGHEICYGKPELIHVDPEDIRVHTSNICRYSGALKWELVRHLALCVSLLPLYSQFLLDERGITLQQAYAAAHDFHEIYVGDVVSGFKKYLPQYREIEHAWEVEVHSQIGLPWEHRIYDVVRHVDVRSLVCEMWVLGHPAAEDVASQYGGTPTEEELEIFESVRSATLEECWNLTWRTVTKGRRLLDKVEHQLDII